MRAYALKHRPPAESLGAHAVHAVRGHTDETHAAALRLIEELLAIGPGGAQIETFVALPDEPAPAVLIAP